MRRFMRVEFSDEVRSSHTRLVLTIELPGQVMQQLRAERVTPQARALQVGFQALPKAYPGHPRGSRHPRP